MLCSVDDVPLLSHIVNISLVNETPRAWAFPEIFDASQENPARAGSVDQFLIVIVIQAMYTSQDNQQHK